MSKKYLISDFFENNENIHAGFYIEHREKNLHSHDFWEISYVYEGSGTHYYGNNEITDIKSGEVILITPNTEHCIKSPNVNNGGWVKVLNLLIKDDYIRKIIKRLSLIRELEEYKLMKKLVSGDLFFTKISDFAEILYRMLMNTAHEYNHFTYGSSVIIENCIVNILIYMIRLYELNERKDNVATTKDETIDKIIRYIQLNYSSEITLENLSSYTHLSREYLSRYFKKITGKNISVYISEIRIERAKYMLRTTKFRINDICYLCGYKSYSNFQKSFKKIVGISAGEYRLRAK